MKKVIFGLMVLSFVSCNSSSTEKVESTDSTKVSVDSSVVDTLNVTVDTLSK